MSNINVKNKDIINLLNNLYFYNLNFVFELSESLYNSLKIGWANYIDNVNSSNKKERNLEKVNKNIKKLENIEKKKLNNEILKEIKDNNLKYIDTNSLDINSKLKKKLCDKINSSSCLSEIFNYIIDNYNQYIVSGKDKKEQVVMLPRKKDVIEERQSYYIDKNGYLYLNIISENGAMILDRKSIDLEKKKYKKALHNNSEIFDKFAVNIKISPFEKKRRIYIQSMFELEKSLLNLEQKNIDITYPIEKYFIYSKNIVDNMYKELTNFRENEATVLNNLMEITIRNYGCEKILFHYNCVVSKFNKEIFNVERYIIDEVNDISNKMKDDLIEFKNIKGLVPSIIDIYRVINTKMIRSAGIFCDDYIKDIKTSVINVTKYMSIEEIIEFYIELKNILLNNSFNNANRLTQYLIELQKTIVILLEKKTEYEEEIIFKEYLKEEKIY